MNDQIATGPLRFESIRRLLPYSPPFLMIDRVIRWSSDDGIEVQKVISGADPFVAAHFPEGPAVAPAIILIELVGQAGMLLGILTNGNAERRPAFMGRAKCSFSQPAFVGDVVTAKVRVESVLTKGMVVTGSLYVQSERIGSVELIGSSNAGQKIANDT